MNDIRKIPGILGTKRVRIKQLSFTLVSSNTNSPTIAKLYNKTTPYGAW